MARTDNPFNSLKNQYLDYHRTLQWEGLQSRYVKSKRLNDESHSLGNEASADLRL